MERGGAGGTFAEALSLPGTTSLREADERPRTVEKSADSDATEGFCQLVATGATRAERAEWSEWSDGKWEGRVAVGGEEGGLMVAGIGLLGDLEPLRLPIRTRVLVRDEPSRATTGHHQGLARPSKPGV